MPKSMLRPVLTRARLYDLAYYHGRVHDRPLVRFLLEQFGSSSSSQNQRTLLDCACGTGEPGLHLAPYFTTTFSDASGEMLAIAREKAARRGLEAKFVEARWRDLPRVLDEQFDLVLCAGAALSQIEEPQERRESILGMAEMLACGGKLYLDFASDWPTQTHDKYKHTDTIGPIKWKKNRLLILIHERVDQAEIRRVKTCYSTSSPDLNRLSRVVSFNFRIEEKELLSDLTSAGLKVVAKTSRPGRWPMTSILARREK